jgi:hypothetical protein
MLTSARRASRTASSGSQGKPHRRCVAARSVSPAIPARCSTNPIRARRLSPARQCPARDGRRWPRNRPTGQGTDPRLRKVTRPASVSKDTLSSGKWLWVRGEGMGLRPRDRRKRHRCPLLSRRAPGRGRSQCQHRRKPELRIAGPPPQRHRQDGAGIPDRHRRPVPRSSLRRRPDPAFHRGGFRVDNAMSRNDFIAE